MTKKLGIFRNKDQIQMFQMHIQAALTLHGFTLHGSHFTRSL